MPPYNPRMIKTFSQILAEDSIDTIEKTLKTALQHSNESPFWLEKALPLAHAVLSVTIPLRDQKLLFDPEGGADARPASALVRSRQPEDPGVHTAKKQRCRNTRAYTV